MPFSTKDSSTALSRSTGAAHAQMRNPTNNGDDQSFVYNLYSSITRQHSVIASLKRHITALWCGWVCCSSSTARAPEWKRRRKSACQPARDVNSCSDSSQPAELPFSLPGSGGWWDVGDQHDSAFLPAVSGMEIYEFHYDVLFSLSRFESVQEKAWLQCSVFITATSSNNGNAWKHQEYKPVQLAGS